MVNNNLDCVTVVQNQITCGFENQQVLLVNQVIVFIRQLRLKYWNELSLLVLSHLYLHPRT